MKIRVLAIYFLVFTGLPHGYAAAQDYGSDFQEKMESYRPPPMFDDGSIKQFPVETKTINNSVDPGHEPSAQTVTAVGDAVPPIPRRRPVKFKASPELLKRVISEQKPPAPAEDDLTKITRIEPQAGSVEDISAEPIENLLEQPSVQDILQKLDATPAQETADITTRIEANRTPVKTIAVRPVKELEKSDEPPAVRAQGALAMNPPETIEKNALAISLFFDGAAPEISEGDEQLLEVKALPLLRARPDLRIQIQAFAADHDQGQNAARRLSLLRAISIREFLVDRDIDPARIDLRALGSQTEIQPPDRADILLLESGKTL